MIQQSIKQAEEFNKASCIESNNKNEEICAIKKLTNSVKFKSQAMKLNKATDCIRCGYSRHKNQSDCPAVNKKCNHCGKVGHFMAVCLKNGNIIVSNQAKIN